jgi:hypothetical protein
MWRFYQHTRVAIAVCIFFPPGVKGYRVVEDIEPNMIASFLLGREVGCAPRSIASGTGETEICSHHLGNDKMQTPGKEPLHGVSLVHSRADKVI